MQSLEDQIKNLLNPNDKISVITEGILTSYKPIMPVSLMVEVIRDSPNEVQTKLLSMLNEPGIVIFGGVIYIKTGSVEIKDRIARIFTAYTEKIESIIGEKKALIEFTVNLNRSKLFTFNKTLFRLETFVRNRSGKIHSDVEYEEDIPVPSFNAWDIHQSDLGPVIYDGVYDHMFVYRDYGHVGRRLFKLCLGIG